MIREYKWNIIAVLLLSAIVLVLPLFYKSQYLIINDDTARHLATFEAIKTGNASFMYLGQEMVGYGLVGAEKLTGIGIPVMFMWFNFLSLIIGGAIISVLVMKMTKSKMVSVISVFAVVFTGAILRLFWAGTIFGIIEMIIILPITLLALNYFIKKITPASFALLVLSTAMLLLFHPDFGIQTNSTMGGKLVLTSPITIDSPTQASVQAAANPVNPVNTETKQVTNAFDVFFIYMGVFTVACIILCGIQIVMSKIRLNKNQFAVLGFLGFIALVFGTLVFTDRSSFSVRVAYNFAIVMSLLMCLLLGIVIKNSADRKSDLIKIIVALSIVGILPNLIGWVGQYGISF